MSPGCGKMQNLRISTGGTQCGRYKCGQQNTDKMYIAIVYEYLKYFNTPLKYNKIHNINIKNAGIKYLLLNNKRVIS